MQEFQIVLPAKVKIKNSTSWVYLRLFQIGEHGIGSCLIEVDHLLEDALELGICDQLMAEGQACSLPLMPGSYAPGSEAMEVVIPEIPAALEPFIKGNIEAKAYGIKADGTEVACLQTLLELA